MQQTLKKTSERARRSLEQFLHSHLIDNFRIDGDAVRIGSRTYRALECQCGVPGCDGWEMVPLGS
jgi:hypothetical protein